MISTWHLVWESTYFVTFPAGSITRIFPYAGTYRPSDLKTNPGFLGCVQGRTVCLWGEMIFRVFRVAIDEGLK